MPFAVRDEIHGKAQCSLQKAEDFKVLRWSLIEGYIRHELGVHLHIAINNSKRTELCLSFGRGRIENGLSLSFDNLNEIGIGGHYGSRELCDEQSSMLVDVRELMECPEMVSMDISPTVVGLKRLDKCLCAGSDTSKIAAPYCVSESLLAVTNGKCSSVGGLVAMSPYKFPYQVIETGPEVTENISEEQGDFRRDRDVQLSNGHGPQGAISIKIALWLGHNSARLRMNVASDFPVQSVKMLACPFELCDDRLQVRHDSE